MLRTILCVLCLVPASWQLSVTSFNVPSTTELGSSVELECKHDGPLNNTFIKWWWQPLSSDSNRLQLYQYMNGVVQLMPNGFNLTSDKVGTLVLWNLQPLQSGTFMCDVDENGGNFDEVRKKQNLIVYSTGGGPILNMTKYEGETEVQLSCEANGVAPKPKITLSFGGKSFDSTFLSESINGYYDVRVNTTAPEDQLLGTEVTCTLSFDDTDVADTSINETYYTDEWLATTSTPQDNSEAAEALATPESTAELLPGGAGRLCSPWLIVLFSSVAVPLHIYTSL